jgi:O-acetyl-ADP-ribose deacetylase (regulator of RNase III)
VEEITTRKRVKRVTKPLLSYVTGDATEPQGQGNHLIVHCVNNIGVWGAGFVLALSAKWKAPEAEYRAWFQLEKRDAGYCDRFGLPLGEVQCVQVTPEITVLNLVGQQGTCRNRWGRPPIRYDAIDQGLEKVMDHSARWDAQVHMPRMGCGLAGGDWRVIEALIKKNLTDNGVRVTVYDLPSKP